MIYDVYFYTSDDEDSSELYDLATNKLEDGIIPNFNENELLSEIKNVLKNQSFYIDYDEDIDDINFPTFEFNITLDDEYVGSYGNMLRTIKYVFEGGMDYDFYESIDEDELNR